LYDEKYRLMEDYPRWLKLSRLGLKFKYWNRVVVKYRTNGMSNSNNINIDFKKEELFAFEDLLKYCYGFRRCIVFINIILMRLIINHLEKKSEDGHHAIKDIIVMILEIFEMTHKLLSNIFIIFYVNIIQLTRK
ncbi:MAG: hypothetical protein Q4Q53_07255, partial [Methanocorpusculum sp.]|nr:hypothetical protein [Methanocorpusculum sp.]